MKNLYRLTYHSVRFYDSGGRLWVAPVGLLTDGGSVPWFVQPIVGGPWQAEAIDGYVLHDAAYQLAPPEEASFLVALHSPARAAADQMLYEALLARGEHPLRAREIHAGVRAGGWRAWRQHATQNRRQQP